MKKAEKEHMARVAEMGCIVCSSRPVSVHHALTGGGGRKNHMKVLPLCYGHHQGKQGIHTIGRKVWRELYGSEIDLLHRVQQAIQSTD